MIKKNLELSRNLRIRIKMRSRSYYLIKKLFFFSYSSLNEISILDRIGKSILNCSYQLNSRR